MDAFHLQHTTASFSIRFTSRLAGTLRQNRMDDGEDQRSNQQTHGNRTKIACLLGENASYTDATLRAIMETMKGKE